MDYDQESQGGVSPLRGDVWSCGGCLLALLLAGLVVWALVAGLDRLNP